MARQRTAIRVNQIAGGFNTEANPLSFPDGSSFDEQNLDFRGDGSRRRRNGFDVEVGAPINTGVMYPGEAPLGRNQYLWEGAGGIPGRDFLVVQVGNYLGVHTLEQLPLSSNLIYSTVFNGAAVTQRFDLTTISGSLVIAIGRGNVWVLTYDGEEFSISPNRLLIRDLFGVESGELTRPQNYTLRPRELTDTHLYNLRNQTFAQPRMTGLNNQRDVIDPVQSMFEENGFYPSNADNVTLHLAADPNKDSNRTAERFNPQDMQATPPSNSKAPTGYFIIDALMRGQSRRHQFRQLTSKHEELEWRPRVDIPDDITTGGASVVCEYAGRVWFSGFEGSVIDGDKKSPDLSSYLLFSQVVKETDQIFWCYQSADPTSHTDPDLVDTDGGFLRIDGANRINRMVNLETSLFVFAENGVWSVTGADGNTFTATSYTVRKISDEGCISPGSVVLVEGSLLYWSKDGIQSLARNRVGDWVVTDLTEDTIRSFYHTIPATQKKTCSGYYDTHTNTIRWVYGADLLNREVVHELVLSKKFQAFGKNLINIPSGLFGPITVSGGDVGNTTQAAVTVQGVPVTVNGELVTAESLYGGLIASQNFYCTITQISPQVQYKFGGYSTSVQPYDWVSIEPTDSPSFITTGFLTGGEGRLRKDVPYITTYFQHTEAEEPPVDSSCLFQARWDWTINPNGGKWTSPRQAYRLVGVRTGEEVVKTKNKVRGSGTSVAFSYTSEPGKFFHLLGWEHNIEATTDE